MRRCGSTRTASRQADSRSVDGRRPIDAPRRRGISSRCPVMMPTVPSSRRAAIFAVLAAFFAGAFARADVVVRHDGSTLRCRVIAVDEEAVVVEVDAARRSVPRVEVAEIRFDRDEPVIRVEIKNIDSDDALDVLLEGETVLREGRRGGEWIDLTPRLKDGNNAVRFRIRNARGPWAYRVALRVNGETTILECGTPHRGDDPCRDFGHSGIESGTIDDLPPFWIHVDRATGRVEVLR